MDIYIYFFFGFLSTIIIQLNTHTHSYNNHEFTNQLRYILLPKHLLAIINKPYKFIMLLSA